MSPARLFISHSWKYNEYERLIDLLNRREGFTYRNSSVAYDKALEGHSDKVWEQIYNKIRWCQVFLFTAGVEASHSRSIEQEINIAHGMNKPIIAVKPHTRFGTNLTRHRKLADELVHWRSDSVTNAINSWIN